MHFESLDGALCLVASVVARGDQFELYLLLVDVYCLRASDALLSDVCFFIPSPAILILLIIFRMPLSFPLSCDCALFDQYEICVEVDGHHYIPVASLRCEGKCSRLIGVDGISEVVDAEESLVHFGDGYLVER